jgi:hypothetical protein
MQRARTLAEARLYVALTAAADDAPIRTDIGQGDDAWTVVADGRDDIEIEVPYATEAAAHETGEHYGAGRSAIIDAGQWMQVSLTYGRSALADDLAMAAEPGGSDRYEHLVESWELAREAALEALKFLPDDAEEIPGEAFWTDSGRAAHRESPERFTRGHIVDDLSFYQDSLTDARRTHGGR